MSRTTHDARPRTTRPAPDPVPDHGWDAGRLADLVRWTADRPWLWRGAVHFDDAERQWARLDSPAGVDVWLLTWLCSQGTDLHDHGDSTAALTVVQGSLVEVRTDDAGTLRPTLLEVGGVRIVRPGTVHDVRNERDIPAASIHAYSPRLERMTFYEQDGDRVVATRTVLTDEPEIG